MSEQKINLIEVEINKISLKPGDVLLAKVSGPEFQSDEVCEALQRSLKKVFPNNAIGVILLEKETIDFTVISQEVAEEMVKEHLNEEKAPEIEESPCNSGKSCLNCKCGDKEVSNDPQ